jgi:hypothetical protein
MRILAIDPGPTECGWVLWDAPTQRIVRSEIAATRSVLEVVDAYAGDILAIEMIASYGMAVGREVFETCVWIGRIQQSASDPDAVRLVYRKAVKLHLCGSPRAKDANIRQALIDRLGPAGTKKAPGPTYGVKSHAWAALAVAVTVGDELMPQRRAA